VTNIKDVSEVMANVESIRKKRELMRAGDYSRIDRKRGYLVDGHEFGSWYASKRNSGKVKKRKSF
jgi:hypothetical protein